MCLHKLLKKFKYVMIDRREMMNRKKKSLTKLNYKKTRKEIKNKNWKFR